MKLLIALFFLICYSNVIGQSATVNRNTEKRTNCNELGCDNSDSTYSNIDRACLNCLMSIADSTMQSEKSKIIQKFKDQQKKEDSFIQNQDFWQIKTEKHALDEGDNYKGGTMELTEYVRVKLIETSRRINYLREYYKKL